MRRSLLRIIGREKNITESLRSPPLRRGACGRVLPCARSLGIAAQRETDRPDSTYVYLTAVTIGWSSGINHTLILDLRYRDDNPRPRTPHLGPASPPAA